MKKSWWNRKYGPDSICAITRVRLRSGKNRYGQPRSIFLPCRHGFCRTALQEWVVKSPDPAMPFCPLCRRIFDPLLPFYSY